jgi:hypothetical protein
MTQPHSGIGSDVGESADLGAHNSRPYRSEAQFGCGALEFTTSAWPAIINKTCMSAASRHLPSFHTVMGAACARPNVDGMLGIP